MRGLERYELEVMKKWDYLENIEKLKARKNVEGLIKALGDWDVRKSAAYALGEIGGKHLKGS